MVVKPLKRQLSKLSGATEETGVPSPEERGVKRVTGLNTGASGSTLENACFPLGVKRRGDDAAELRSVKGLYLGALKETTELPEEPVRERPGDERIEAAEPDRSGSGEGSRRQES